MTPDPIAGRNAPQSPCTNVCIVDNATGWCKGCARTLSEIAEWGGASADRQWQIMARVEQRRRRAG